MDVTDRVLYLSYDGLTDPLGQSQILPYVIGLSAKGYRFTIVSFEKKAAYHNQKNSINRICLQNNITWIPLRYHKNPPIISTLYDLWTLKKIVRELIKKNKISIIHCRSYITSLIGLTAKKKWNVKFIFDMRGFWADERVEGGLWNLKNPLYEMVYHFFKKKEKQFLVEADHVVSLTHNAKKEIESWKINNVPITVIPTCVDLDLFDPEKIKRKEQANLRAKLGILEDDFVLLYLGSWGTWYLTEEMLEFFSALKKKKSSAKFLIVSTDRIDLRNCLYKDDVIVTSAVREEIPLYVSLAKVSICFVKSSFSKKASSATKMGEIMAMNVPLVVNGGWGDVDTMIGHWGIFGKETLKMDDFINVKIDIRNSFIESLGLDMGTLKYEQVYRCLA